MTTSQLERTYSTLLPPHVVRSAQERLSRAYTELRESFEDFADYPNDITAERFRRALDDFEDAECAAREVAL